MKKLLLWLLMVVVMVALLLGGAAAALYAMTGENKLPQNHPTLGETALEPNGYDWTVPVLGHVVERNFSSLTNLTVQKLGDMGDTSPVLTLPDWVNRSEMTLTARTVPWPPRGTPPPTWSMSTHKTASISWT